MANLDANLDNDKQKLIKADVVVLGSGPAGYVCAIRLAQLGKKVTVVERGRLGGVCLNVGCIPSKALIQAGSLYEKMCHAREMGLEAGSAKINFKKLQGWKESVVKKLTGGVAGLLKANGCELVVGDARFSGPKSLEVKTAATGGCSGSGSGGVIVVEFNYCVIATGSRPIAIPGINIDQTRIVDSTGALGLKRIPKSMLCIGGGYIGLELGTFYAKVGAKVTIVEATATLLGGVDPDLTKVVAHKLGERGVEVLLQTKVSACKVGSKGVDVTLSTGNAGDNASKNKTRSFDVVVVTVGRRPNSDLIAIEKVGLKADAKGFIAVDGQRRTVVPHIFAIGDVAGEPMLAHKGSKEGIVAAEALAGHKVAYDVVAMPAVIFSDPEIASVGLSEKEAKVRGLDVKVGVFPFAANGRALSISESDGFVKVLGDAKTGRLLGVHIVGPEASNLISEAALALEMGAQVEDLALTVHPHPTLSETLMEAAEALHGQAIHIFKAVRK